MSRGGHQECSAEGATATGAVHGNFGLSFSYYPTPVAELLGQSLPYTLALQLPAIILGWIIGNTLGAVAAYWLLLVLLAVTLIAIDRPKPVHPLLPPPAARLLAPPAELPPEPRSRREEPADAI